MGCTIENGYGLSGKERAQGCSLEDRWAMDSLILEPGAQAAGLGMGPLGTEHAGTRRPDVECGVA